MSIKDQAWRFPDGSQLSYMALKEMGKTPGDIGEIMQEVYRNRNKETLENLGVKGTAVLTRDAEDNKIMDRVDKQRDNDQEDTEEKQMEARTLLEQRRLQEQRDQEAFQKKKEADAKWARENRPDAEAANARIMGLPLGLATFGLGLGLTGQALSEVGARTAGHVNGMNSPMMVASNNGGSLLALGRGAFDLLGPGNDKDIIVKGPNNTASFTPGVPEAAPEVAALNSPARKQAFGLPGMSGPSMTPPGMGTA